MDFKKTQKLYEDNKLSKNPFPTSGVPDEEPEFYVGQKKVIEKLEHTIGISTYTKRSDHMIIVGSYGNGKTHTLKYVKSQINDKLENGSIVGYVSNPRSNFLSIYSQFVKDLGLDTLTKVCYRVLGSVILNESEKEESISLVDEEEKEEVISKIKNDPSSIRDLIDQGTIVFPKLLEVAYDNLLKNIKSLDFISAFLSLAERDYRFDAWNWLIGQSINNSRKKEMNIKTKISDNYDAIEAFLNLKTIFHYVGLGSVVVLIDEFENVISLSDRGRQKMFNHLRHLIDVCPNGLSLILACAPEAWNNIYSEYHAFSDRFRNIETLEPLNTEEAKELIRSYLKDKNSLCGDLCKESFLEQVIENTSGNIRNCLMKLSDKVDQELIEKN